MRNLLFIVSLALFSIAISSCREDFSTEITSGKLLFSKDTIFLDTVFTNIGSSTYTLKVYNKNSQAISIPSVKLGNGESSMYRLNIDGKAGKVFKDIEILGKDSLYIFIETTIDFTKTANPIYTDSIVFEGNNTVQDVKLVTLVKDAHFLFPNRNTQGVIETITIDQNLHNETYDIQGFYLENNTVFKNDKPYVIYGYCVVPENKTLTIEAGAKLHFHSNSGLIISKGATLKIEGELEKPVTIEGDRLEYLYENIPGQWGFIWLQSGSKNNSMNNTIIKNASIGILVDSNELETSPTLTIHNSQIYNSSNYGILGRNTSIEGKNVVINNAGINSLACTLGGSYDFTHCTFTNFWNKSFRNTPSVVINNYAFIEKDEDFIKETRDLNAANFTNCIIDGSNALEFEVDKIEETIFNFSFTNNLLKFNDPYNYYSKNTLYNFLNSENYTNNIFNGKPHFKAPYTNDLIIGEESDAIEKGIESGTTKIPFDILGNIRSAKGDVGAYNHIIFETEK